MEGQVSVSSDLSEVIPEMISSGIQKNSEWMRQPKLRKFYYVRLARELFGYGQIDFEGGSLSRLTFYFDSAAVILDDPVTDR